MIRTGFEQSDLLESIQWLKLTVTEEAGANRVFNCAVQWCRVGRSMRSGRRKPGCGDEGRLFEDRH